MKGISPMVATVLLVAFTIGIGGLISVWLSDFTQQSSKTVSKEGQNQIICSNGAVDLSSLKYCSTTNNISGIIKNNGRITLGNITIQTVFKNGTLVSHALNSTGTGASGGDFLSLRPGQIFSFNVSIGSGSSGNYDRIWVYTNCTGVTDTALESDISAC